MFDDGFFDWNRLAGDRIDSSYSSNPHKKGDRFYVWRETFERGNLKLVIAEKADRYDVGLTSSCNADGEKGMGLGVISGMTYYKNSYRAPRSAIGRILIDLDEEFGSTFEDFLDRCWEMFLKRVRG